MLKKHSINWLVDNTYDGDTDGLIVRLKQRNKVCKVFTIKDYYSCFLPDPKWEIIPFHKDENVFFLGCILMVQKVQRGTPWIPGTLGDFKFCECINYYPILQDYLLNKDHVFTNVKTLKSNWKFYQSCLGENIFVRPNSSKKIFSGFVVNDPQEIFNDNQSTLGDDLLNTELAVLSHAVKIDAEYRYLVVDGEVITGSSYVVNNSIHRKIVDHEYDSYVYEIAQILKYHEVASIVDIGIVNGSPKLIEINAVSCSGLYQMNLDKYIDGVEKACEILIEREEI
jgi:hypothetical protein